MTLLTMKLPAAKSEQSSTFFPAVSCPTICEHFLLNSSALTMTSTLLDSALECSSVSREQSRLSAISSQIASRKVILPTLMLSFFSLDFPAFLAEFRNSIVSCSFFLRACRWLSLSSLKTSPQNTKQFE
uniref:Uncharacterized protein n=1 Tax=Euplotes harpa TaxID=151035 RepID=A0A7S3JD57_9SPIT